MTVESATKHHPHARAVLLAASRPGGAPSHAYLFHGPPGAGKAEAARAFAAELLAHGSADPDRARRRVAGGVHPDLTWVRPSGAAEMLVGDIDEAVVSAASRTPFEAERRVFVIERADTMVDAAANRLLKTLEEPPPYVHLILLSGRLGDVLPTIRSRCLAVRFESLTPDQLADHLVDEHAATAELARSCARLARGDARLARWLVGEDGQALRTSAETYARAALRGDALARSWQQVLVAARQAGSVAEEDAKAKIAERAEQLPDREAKRAIRDGEQAVRRAARRASAQAIDTALSLSALWLRDVACVKDGAESELCNTDRIAALGEDAALLDSVDPLREAVNAVEEARASLIVNPSEELALEALSLRVGRLAAIS